MHNSVAKQSLHHDEDLLGSSADPLLGLLRFVRVCHTELDGMAFAIFATAALVDSIEGLLLTAPELDATELSTAGYGHQQLGHACCTERLTYGNHGLEPDVVACHELTWHQGLQCKAILITLDLHHHHTAGSSLVEGEGEGRGATRQAVGVGRA